MKLTKQEVRAHRAAADLVRQHAEGRALTHDEREHVLDHWHEGAEHEQSALGAFATPRELASHVALEVGSFAGMRVLDLCAGIGRLGAACRDGVDVTCVEINPAYVAAGRAALPGATWHQADAFDLDAWWDGRRFDAVVANPPYGGALRGLTDPATRARAGLRYGGPVAEYRVVEFGRALATRGVFVLPQERVPWRLSGQPHFSRVPHEAHDRFQRETRLELAPNCGIDTDFARSQWRGTRVAVEIALVEYART